MTPEVLIVGGGMITHDQILPSLLYLRDTGVVSKIGVVASRASTIKALVDAFRKCDEFIFGVLTECGLRFGLLRARKKRQYGSRLRFFLRPYHALSLPADVRRTLHKHCVSRVSP